MSIRDDHLLQVTMRGEFTGYARRRRGAAPLVERVAACVALLAAMVLSGVILGATPEQTSGRRVENPRSLRRLQR